MLKLTAYVSGKVQMAGYRSKIVTIAHVFSLKGYVMNLPDSRVKIVAEGPKADLERFLEAVRIKNTLIDVEEIRAEFSEANGSYEEFFKIAGEGETDARLDQAAEYLKDLISAVREGFRDNGLKLDSMNSSLKDISGKQDQIIDRIDGAREEIVSEVSGMRSDLKGRTEERLQRIESDVTEIKARMKS
ncbi:MAG TPA: acylphosphatase [Methanothrix soehngenii]|nr:acylphosphatase [Methanothrix soehngenii]